MPRRKTNGKPRRQPCHAISSFHRIEGNAHIKAEEKRDLDERVAELQTPENQCPACRLTPGMNGGERCEWCDGSGFW